MSSIEIKIEGVELSVEFYYQPAESQTHDYPGCAECVEVESVKVGDIDIIDMLLGDLINRIEKEILRVGW